MRLLLNMNVPRSLCRTLTEKGFECRHAGDIGLSESDDVDIIKEAKKNEEVIVTHDLDYGHLLAFSGDPNPSVIIFPLRNSHPENLFSRLMGTRSEIEQPLKEGAIVVLEDATLRIRELPITSA